MRVLKSEKAARFKAEKSVKLLAIYFKGTKRFVVSFERSVCEVESKRVVKRDC